MKPRPDWYPLVQVALEFIMWVAVSIVMFGGGDPIWIVIALLVSIRNRLDD